MTVLIMVHLDGFITMAASLFLLGLGHERRHWYIRAPILSMAFAYFALGLTELGLHSNSLPLERFWLRCLADCSVFALLVLRLRERGAFGAS